MEHGVDLKYSIAHFEKEIKYINELLQYMKMEHLVAKKLVVKRTNYEKCLSILNNYNQLDYDPEVAIISLRGRLPQLKEQAKIVPDSQKIIDEIEYVTKLLRNGKS